MAKGDRPSTTGARAIQMAGANRCVYIKAKKQLRYSYRSNGGNYFHPFKMPAVINASSVDLTSLNGTDNVRHPIFARASWVQTTRMGPPAGRCTLAAR